MNTHFPGPITGIKRQRCPGCRENNWIGSTSAEGTMWTCLECASDETPDNLALAHAVLCDTPDDARMFLTGARYVLRRIRAVANEPTTMFAVLHELDCEITKLESEV